MIFGFKRKKEENNEEELRDTGMTIETEIEELIKFSVFYVSMTNKLLVSKGFATDNSYETLSERIALLHTEVSELVDAEKKGLPPEKKGEEVADIVIRLLNIPIMFPRVYLDLKSTPPVGTHTTKVFYPIYREIPQLNKRIQEIRSDKSLRLSITNTMHEKITQLQKALVNYNEETNTLELIIILIFDILNLCNLYISISPAIKGNLRDLVNSKMKKNFERPYQYNVSKDF